MTARTILLVGVATALGCADPTSGTKPSVPRFPSRSIASAAIRATVDVATGTMTFDPLSSPPASGHSPNRISAAIYGDQGLTVRLYNSPVIVSTPVAGKKTYTADVGIRNLLTHPIGDEQAGPTPLDINGIFVFVNSGPTVTGVSSPCTPACTVTVKNQHGTRAFSAPSQKYWYWPERLGVAGTSTDTTLLRKAWVFEADTQVTSFHFDVLVSATWPSPNEGRWILEYAGDSAPHLAAEPRWRQNAGSLGTSTPNTPSAGLITLTTPPQSSQYFLRYDSIGSTSSAYAEARVKTMIPTTAPEVAFAIDDDTRFIGVGLSGTRVGFLSASFAFLLPSFAASTDSLHTYQIRKFGADSAQLWMDGTRIDSRPYTAFPTSIAGLPYFIAFGGPGTGANPISPGGNASAWDYVIFEKGVIQP